MDLHKCFQKLTFSENIGFSGGFSNNINIRFQTLLMNSPTFHMLTFFKILVFSGNQWIKGNHTQWRLQFIFVWIEQINFWGNVMFKQCMICKHYWLYYVNQWWRMLLCFIYIQCYGIQLSHDSARTFPPSGSGVWQVGIRALFIVN